MVKYSEVFRELKRDGWYVWRQKGSHIIMKHPYKNGVLIFPYHGAKEVHKGILKDLLKKAKIRLI